MLFDWNPRYLYRRFFDGDAEAMERYLAKIDFSGWNLKQDAGRPFAAGVAELCAQFPEYQELIRAYDECYEETIAGVLQPTVEILRTLKEKGYPLYGLTNWSSEKFWLVRPKYEFIDWFRDTIVSGDVKLVKPDPRIFKLLLDRTRCEPQACLIVDDSLENVIAARDLGFDAIHYQSPAQLESELRQLGVLP